MVKINTTPLLFLSLILLSGTLSAQNITVINHDLSAFHSNPTSTYFAEDGNEDIWVLQWGGFTDDHVVRYDGNTWTEIDFDGCNNCTRRIAADNTGTVHLSTTSGIYSWNGSSWDQISSQSAADSDIAFDSQNNLWFQTGSGGNNLASLSSGGGLLNEYPTVNGSLFDITIAQDDRVWLRNAGVVGVFDGNAFTAFNQIFSPLYIEEAADGTIYVTDSFGSVSGLQNGSFIPNVFSGVTVSGLAHNSFAVDQNNDIAWFGQQGIEPGLVYYRGTTRVYIPSDQLFMDDFSPGLVDKSFVASNGTLWVGSNFISDVAEVTPEISAVFETAFSKVEIFPNPATTSIQMKAGLSSRTAVSVIIYDPLGRVISSEKINPGIDALEVNIQHLEAGHYYFSIPDEMIYGQFVKEK